MAFSSPSSPSGSWSLPGALLPMAFGFLGGIIASNSFFGTNVLFRRNNDNKKKIATAKNPDDANKSKAEAHLWKLVQYSFSASLIRAGDKLDIYEKLFEAKQITARELAAKYGWSPRWVQEFLLQSVAAGICSFQQQQAGDVLMFSLKSEYASFLRPPTKEKKSLAGMFQLLLPLVNRSDSVAAAIETGVGIDYDWDGGKESDADDVTFAMDRKNRNWFQHSLVDDLLAKIVIPSTKKRLVDFLDDDSARDRPITIADIGCGCGASSIALANRFPHAHVYAFESSSRAMQVMKDRIKAQGITNITICDVSERTVIDGPFHKNEKKSKGANTFDFVYAHDVLHDMTQPRELIRDIFHTLSDDGCWVIIDINCSHDVVANLKKPEAATLYGFSCLLCLSCSSSTKDGEALGTCGFPPQLARKWIDKAGFAHFVEHDVSKVLPSNSCFVISK